MYMTANQRRIIRSMLSGTGRLSANTFNELCGSPRVVRAMFRDHLVEGDGIPAVYISVTDAARETLAAQGTE